VKRADLNVCRVGGKARRGRAWGTAARTCRPGIRARKMAPPRGRGPICRQNARHPSLLCELHIRFSTLFYWAIVENQFYIIAYVSFSLLQLRGDKVPMSLAVGHIANIIQN
jgi:hypothetical protein